MTNKKQKLLADRIKAREAEIERFVSYLGKVVGRELQAFVRQLQRSRDDISQSIRILGQIEDALVSAGYETGARELGRIYGKELKAAREIFAESTGLSFRVTDTDLSIIETAIEFDVDTTAATLSKFGADTKQLLFNQIFIGQQPDLSEVEEVLEPRLLRNIKTELNTTVQTFYRTVNVRKASEVGITEFMYQGPYDKVTRDFCRGILNKGGTFTREEISKLDNGQGLDVMTSCGGYNCRHVWLPAQSKALKKALENIDQDIIEEFGPDPNG